MTNYISEIISAILGFISGGFTVGIFMHIKDNRISSKHQGNNIASSGGVAAGNVQGNIVITNTMPLADSKPVLSSEAQRILKELHPDTYIYFSHKDKEMIAYSETRAKRKVIFEDYSCTAEALNELESFQYLENKQAFQWFTIYKLTAQGRMATSNLFKE